MPEVRIYSKKQKIPKDIKVIKLDKYPELDPTNIGPCLLYKGRKSNNLHNAWEYSKVYKEYSENGQPTNKYWEWAMAGWKDDKAAKTTKKKYLYHFWDGTKYGVIEARKKIYASMYIRVACDHEKYYELRDIANDSGVVALVAAHGLDYKRTNLTEVLFNPDKEFDYAFLLAMMLSKDNSLMDIP